MYTTLYLLNEGLQAPQQWNFDLLSALIGAAATFLITILVYVYREQLERLWQRIAEPANELGQYLAANAMEQYQERITTWADGVTIPRGCGSLDELFVTREAIIPAPAPQSTAEIEQGLLHALTMPFEQAFDGHNRLILVGTPGSGRTTVMAHLALTAIADMEEEAKASEEPASEPPTARLPIYVSLPAISWQEEAAESEEVEEDDRPSASDADTGDEQTPEAPEEKSNEGIDRLVKAALASIQGGAGLSRLLQQYLEAGRATIMLDGWDRLSPQQKEMAAEWLTQLTEEASENVWLVGAAARQYGQLAESGFVPIRLKGWGLREAEALARNWATAYPEETPAGATQTHALIYLLQQAARTGDRPLTLALRAFVFLSGEAVPDRRAALFDRALDLLLWRDEEKTEEQPWLPAACRNVLGQVAYQLQQADQITVARNEIEEAITVALPPQAERPANADSLVLRRLTDKETGLLRSVGSNQYTFAHPLWQAYLAARSLVASSPESLKEKLDDPRWRETLVFYAELGDMAPLVSDWLRERDDLFFNRLQTLGRWIEAAPDEADWRDGAMAVLARAFLRPGLPLPVRVSLGESLARSGVSGVRYFLHQALKHQNPEVRIAAVTGLARLSGEPNLASFEAVLGDEELAVRQAAVEALGSLGTEAARSRLEKLLEEGEEELGPLAAEAIAAFGKDSLDFLHELANSTDMMSRRAAVFGLTKLGAEGLLQTLAREDGQWIVRSAASAALDMLKDQESIEGVTPHPPLDQLPWLVSWAAAKGEGLGVGEAARHTLVQALEAETPAVRLAAAFLLIRIGRPSDVPALKQRLKDPAPEVAQTAFVALKEIGQRYGLKIEQ